MELTKKRAAGWLRKWATWTVCGLLSATNLAAAGDKVLVVSIKPTNQLIADTEYLLESTGTSPFGQFILPQVKNYLQGVDGDRPIGAVVEADGNQFRTLVFVPVSDMDKVKGHLKEQLGEPSDAGNGVLEWKGPRQLFLKQQGNWAFIGQKAESLASVPADPRPLLDGLEGQYTLAARVFAKNVPQEHKDKLIQKMGEGMRASLEKSDDPQAKAVAEAQLAQLTQAVKETDTLTLGWQIDSKGRQVYIDTGVVALPGTKMASQCAAMQKAVSSYTSFLVPNAAIQANLSGVIPPDQIETTLQGLNQAQQTATKELEKDDHLDEAGRNGAKKLIGMMFDIVRATVKTGKVDTCTSIVTDAPALTLVSASHVANGSDVEKALKEMVSVAKNSPDTSFSSVKFNAAQHGNVKFHTMDLPIPEDEKARKLLGETLHVTVGVGDTSVYMALGPQGIESLKKLIDGSKSSAGTKVSPFNVDLSLIPILKFAESVDPNPVVSSLNQILAACEGKDHLRVQARGIENGAQYRLQLEEGVLKAIGHGAIMARSGSDQ